MHDVVVSVVPSAVSIVTMMWITVFQNSLFFILQYNFNFNTTFFYFNDKIFFEDNLDNLGQLRQLFLFLQLTSDSVDAVAS